jgi:transcription antitermination factor NusG
VIVGIGYSSPSWIAVYVETGAEMDVQAELAMAGRSVYLPLERINGKPGKPHKLRPLFRGYVFAEVMVERDDWGDICGVKGVIDVLCQNGKPWRIPSGAMSAIMRTEAYGGFDYRKSAKVPFDVGETVRIGAGMFSGFNAVIQKYVAKIRSATASKRAKVLLEFMGAMRSLEIDVCELERL